MKMKNYWTNQELDVYLKYCKFNNLIYDCIWAEMNESERKSLLHKLHLQMIEINKPIRLYVDFEYIKSIKYSLLDFVKEELPGKLVTWIPDNFESKQDMLNFLDKHIQLELQNN